jgi:hypothetical protein
MNWVGLGGASALGCLISAAELGAVQRKAIPVRALPWVLLRLGIESGSSAIAYGTFITVFDGLRWFTGAWPTLLAGLVGPAILRSQLSVLGSGEEVSGFGPATAYRKFQMNVDQAIDEASAVSQAHWIVTGVLPRLNQMPLGTFTDSVRFYIKGLDRLTEQEKTQQLAFVEQVLTDTVSDEEKCKTICERLLDFGGRRLVQRLISN